MSTASQQHILQGTKGFTFCHWCTQQMPASAKYCPHCRKLRKDIHDAKANFYTFAIVFGLLFIGAVGLISKTAAKNNWWNVKVERTPISVSADASFMERLVLSTAEEFAAEHEFFPQYKFSVEKFLSSGSGIFLIIFGLVTIVATGYLGHRVSKKLGTSFWI